MSTSRQAPKLTKLEDEPLWKVTNELVEFFYSILANFPEEEKWNTEVKLRQEANNLLLHVSEGLANSSPSGAEYEWANVRKAASSLKTLYRFAGRQKFIDIDPDIMVKLTGLLTEVDKKVLAAFEAAQAYNQQELDEWRERYTLWKDATAAVDKARKSL